MTESREREHDSEPDQAMIAVGVAIVLGLLFCVVMFLMAG
jgi:hypothetical protein